MVNFKLINKILGQLLFIEAMLMLSCLIMSFCYKEDDLFGFLIAFILTILTATTLRYHGHNAKDSLSRRDAYMVVSLTWVVFSLMGALPFLISGYITNFTDAYFEAISGFTTTGATIVNDVERLPHALLFWRTLSQWVGGLGIVFFTIALLPSLTGGPTRIFAAEMTGPIRTKLHPKLSTTAKWIWTIYIFLTLACAGSYLLCGMSPFDAVNYAMTTTATGGFATHNSVASTFATPAMEYVCVLFCFLAGVNFSLLYFSFSKWRPSALFHNAEFRLYFWMVVGCTLAVAAILFIQCDYDAEHALRAGLFQVVSFLTSTGLFNEDTSSWPHATWIILGVCMFVGACSGSTSGGIKAIRVVILMKNIRNEFSQMIHPNAVLPLKVNGQHVSANKRSTLLAFLTAYMIICIIAGGILLSAGIDAQNASTILLSCMANVGLSLDQNIGPHMTWTILPVGVKWLCAALMLVGRLEIFTVLILFSRSYWKKN